MSSTLPEHWEVEIPAHAEAVDRFTEMASGVAAPDWEQPLAPGKWSPAEVTAHVTEVYAVLRRELAGEPGMRLRGMAIQRWLLRRMIMPRLLRGRPFPPGVPAPAETRPTTVIADQAAALTAFKQAADQFIGELETHRARGPIFFTHAYFGRGPALHGLRMVTVHLHHHTRQLAAAST